MSPSIEQDKITGRIYLSGSKDESKSWTKLSQDFITKKIFLAGSVGGFLFQDVPVYKDLPNMNWNDIRYWNFGGGLVPINIEVWELGADDEWRTLIKVPPNKTLHLSYVTSGYSNKIDVYEVDPNSYDSATVTWNTQPVLGDLVCSWYTSDPYPPDDGHTSFATGTTGAICLVAGFLEDGVWAEDLEAPPDVWPDPPWKKPYYD